MAWSVTEYVAQGATPFPSTLYTLEVRASLTLTSNKALN